MILDKRRVSQKGKNGPLWEYILCGQNILANVHLYNQQMLRRHLNRAYFQKVKENLIERFGIKTPTILRNLKISEYYEWGMLSVPADPETRKSCISDSGAFVAFSGEKTGRSPKDKRIVSDQVRSQEIWWGDVNKPLESKDFQILKDTAISYLNTRPKLYVVDGYAGWDKSFRIKVRIVCTRAYHALFMHNMLIRPTKEELQTDFHDGADYNIFNAGEFHAAKNIPGISSHTSVALDFGTRTMVILGSQYAGEMKKGVFTIMHYLMPKQGLLSLHSSANEGKDGDVTLFFGLSGTGKTALSTDPHRKLIGDDEHVWGQNGVFNIQGGCYAKCVGLTQEKEPDIYNAIKFGSVLQNVNFYPKTKSVNYFDTSITENTRCSYPLEYINNAKIPATGGHPKNIIFLTCDAYGVLPPISKLTEAQAMYHFLSGYTSKIAGTQEGIKEPQASFSACFGQAFLPFHPNKYALLLAEKIKQHGSKVWLLNTGWSGGRYGVGKRISIADTRKIIDSIHDGSLQNAPTAELPIFGLKYPIQANGVNPHILTPRETWANKTEYDNDLTKVAHLFKQNFKRFEKGVNDDARNAGPKID